MKLYVPEGIISHQLSKHTPSEVELISLSNVLCDFSACTLESHIDEYTQAVEGSGTPVQALSLLNKEFLVNSFKAAGMSTLAMLEFTNEAQIDSLGGKPFILKPVIGLGSSSIISLAYRIFDSKQEFSAAVLSDCPNFWEQQNDPDLPTLFIQESVVSSTEQALLTILNGFINGSGEIVYLPILENFQIKGQPTETSPIEISLENQLMLKEKTRLVLNTSGVKNSFFMMQFVRKVGGQWFPLDFQFRLDYCHMQAAPKAIPEFCKDLIRFTYDLIPSVSIPAAAQPFQKFISVNMNSHRLKQAIKSADVFPLSFETIDSHIYRPRVIVPVMFCAYGETLVDAESKLNAFASSVESL